MKTQILKLLTIAILATFAASLTVNAAPEKKEAAAKEESKDGKPGIIPFHGKISAVDKAAKTVTLEGKEKTRTFQVTSETKIEKGGQPATLDDAKIGEEVGGSYVKSGEKMELRKLRVGPKPEGAEKAKDGEKKKKKE